MRYTLTKDEGVTTLHYVVDNTFRLTVVHTEGHYDVKALCLKDQTETEWKKFDEGFLDMMNPAEEEILTWQMCYPTITPYLTDILNSVTLIKKNNEYHKEIF